MSLTLVAAMHRGPEDVHAPPVPGNADGGDGNNAEKLADAAVSFWNAVENTLAPVIGGRAVAALFQRSLHLVRRRHPSLEALCLDLGSLHGMEALREILVRQSPAEMSLFHAELLQTFRGLLDHLIGPSLTARLLQPVWPPTAGDAAAQNTPP